MRRIAAKFIYSVYSRASQSATRASNTLPVQATSHTVESWKSRGIISRENLRQHSHEVLEASSLNWGFRIADLDGRRVFPHFGERTTVSTSYETIEKLQVICAATSPRNTGSSPLISTVKVTLVYGLCRESIFISK